MLYITKHALSQGIIEVNTDEIQELSTKNGRLSFWNKNGLYCSFAKGEWYTNKSLAVIDAEARRKKKIAALEQQIEMLKGIKFE